jgi:HPt (histidine-containing phosphotransfer) domain-containing protein
MGRNYVRALATLRHLKMRRMALGKNLESVAMSPASHGYLDTQLALDQIGDVESMNGMLVMLQESLTRDIPLVSDMLAANQITEANRVLHALKGFVPIFCSQALCSHVVNVEAQSKDSQSTTVVASYAVLKPELEALLNEVNTHLQAAGLNA